MRKKLLFKRIAYLILLNFFAFSLSAQEGPGGVGDASNNPFWFAADQMIGINNNDPVNTWNNLGSEVNTANQSSNINTPTFVINQMNGLPALSFDGDDFLEIPDNNALNRNGPYSSRTISMVIQTGANVNNRQVLYEEGGAIRGLNIYIENGDINFGGYNFQASDGADSPWGYASTNTSVVANTSYVITFRFAGNASQTGTITAFLNGSLVGTLSNIGRLYNHNEAVIGAQNNDGYYTNGSDSGNNVFNFTGLISELIIYSKALNTSERIILENYLGSKYNSGLAVNDFNLNDLPVNGDFDFNSVGIAQISNTDSHLLSNIGTGIVSIENSSLTDNTSLIISSDNTNNTDLEATSVGCSINLKDLYRTSNTWRISKIGSFTNTTLNLDLSTFGYANPPSNDVQLEVSNNSNFTGTTTIYNISSINGDVVSFNNINFNDGEYFKFLVPDVISTQTPLPAGASSYNNTKFWWRAESINQTNNSSVSSWDNEGSNINDAAQTVSNNQPLYMENQFNTYPALDFTSTDKHLIIPNNNDINLIGPFSQRTFTMTFETSSNVTDKQVLYEEGGGARNLHMLIENGNLIVGGFNNSNTDGPGDNWINKQISTPINADTRYVVSFIFNGSINTSNNPDGNFQMYLNSAPISIATGVGFLYAHSGDINIGGHTDSVLMNGSTSSGNYFTGKIAEFSIHASALSTEETLLLHTYMASKYDINLGAQNLNVYNTNTEGDFDHHLVALFDFPGSSQNDSKFGTGIVRLKNPSGLSNGEYLFIASDNKNSHELDVTDINCNLSSADNQKLKSIWRVGEAGNIGSLSIDLNVSDLNIPATSYTDIELLVSSNPAFSSPTIIASNGLACENISFNNVSLSNGDYFTFRIKDLEPITWDGSQFLNGSGAGQAPGPNDTGRKLVIQSGADASIIDNASVGCVKVNPSAKMLLGSGIQLDVNGNMSIDGDLDANTGTINMNGEQNQSIDWANEVLVGDLELNTSYEVELISTAINNLRISSLVRVSNGGTLQTNGKLVLGCQFTDLTQRVAQIDDLSNGTVVGEIETEQCIPARRAFRFVSSPVTTPNSIHDNWQEAAISSTDNPNPDHGTHITGSITDQINGFDATPSGNPSLFVYDNATQTWSAIANTNSNTLTAGTPYRLLVRGDRSIVVASNTATATSTTLRATGAITSGNIDLASGFNTTNGSFNFFGNPYPAAIDMSQVMVGATGVQKDYYIWDPNLGGAANSNSDPNNIGGRGGFVTVDLESPNIGSNSVGSAANEFLQSGQAAFVRVASPGTPQMLLTENNKNVSVNQTATFSTNPISMIDLTLYKASDLSEGETPRDGLRLKFSDNYTTSPSSEDAAKFGNIDENIAAVNAGKYLAIDRREFPINEEIIPLFLNSYRANQYSLSFSLNEMQAYDIYIVDAYLDEETQITEDGFVFDFNVDANISESIDANRFSLKLQPVTLGLEDLTSENFRMYPNPLTDGCLTIDLPQQMQGQFDVKIHNVLGSSVLDLQKEAEGGQIILSNLNLSSGVYFVEIKSENTQTSFTQKLIVE